MAKYLVETYYTCSFKVNHYLDDINDKELSNLEKRDDGKFEVLDIKLDNRKTKNLSSNGKNHKDTNVENNQKINDIISDKNAEKKTNGFVKKLSEKVNKRFSMPDRRKEYIKKAKKGDHKIYIQTGEKEEGRMGERFNNNRKEE